VGNKNILDELGYKSLSGNVKKALQRLREIEAIVYTIPDKPRSRHQQYAITAKGKSILGVK
jgi:ATP-dependent DNA helicase RecG